MLSQIPPKQLDFDFEYECFMIAGYGIGGPVYIPKVWNRDRHRLFFFVSQEFTQIAQPTTTLAVNQPTAAEIGGDFSNSRNAAGVLIPIIDPGTGRPFPGNLIPANRIDPTGQAYLKLLPAPNGYVNPAPGQQYTANYLASATPSYNRRNTMLRFDSNITDKLSMFYRYGQDVDNDEFEFPVSPGVGTNVRFTPGYVHGVHLTYIASPTLVNEFAFGVGHDNYGFYHTTPDSQWFRTDTLNRPRSARFPRVRSMKTICRAPLIAVALWPARRIFIPAASKLRDRAAISPHTRISMTTICSRTT